MSYQGLVTFIIPTVGRQTLLRAVESVRVQTDLDWSCMVLGDGLDPSTLFEYDDITCHALPHYHHEATVRNAGIDMAETEWVAFLDDDDTVDEHYVAWLREDIETLSGDSQVNSPDVVIFRQVLPRPTELGDTIIPAGPEIVWGNVGISYAVKREWARAYPFKRSRHEDLLQLVALEAAGANIHFSNRLAYYARDKRL